MNQSEAMRGVNGLGDLADEIHFLLERQRRGDAVERDAVNLLHGDVAVPGDLADLEHLADGRMIDARLGPSLALESFQRSGVGDAEKLQGHESSQPRVPRLEDLAHAAAAEAALQNVAVPVEEVAGNRGVVARRCRLTVVVEGRLGLLIGHGLD